MPAIERPSGCVVAVRQDAPGSSLAIAITGKMRRESLPDVCEQAGLLLIQADGRPVICDVGGVDAPDAVAVDGLARLQLAARRLGTQITLQNVPQRLHELLELTGLYEALPVSGGFLEAKGQTE